MLEDDLEGGAAREVRGLEEGPVEGVGHLLLEVVREVLPDRRGRGLLVGQESQALLELLHAGALAEAKGVQVRLGVRHGPEGVARAHEVDELEATEVKLHVGARGKDVVLEVLRHAHRPEHVAPQHRLDDRQAGVHLLREDGDNEARPRGANPLRCA